MKAVGGASTVFGLVLLAASAAGCKDFPFGECPGSQITIPAGGTAPDGGVDPQRGLAALGPQTVPLRWVPIDESTTLTITTAASDQPSSGELGCDSQRPSAYQVSALATVETADGRLHGSFTSAPLSADAEGRVVLPTFLTGALPASTIAGTGLVRDGLLDPTADYVAFTLRLVPAGAGVAGGTGSVSVEGRDRIPLAEINVTP